MAIATSTRGRNAGVRPAGEVEAGDMVRTQPQARARSIHGLATALAALLVSLATGSAAARVVIAADDVPADVAPILSRLSLAFTSGDHEDLVALIHPDGIVVSLGPQVDRTSVMTPAQAHYYFKNLFQLRRTLRFSFIRQQMTGPDRLHAVAVWHWERSDSGRAGSHRLLFTVVRAEGQWRVSEITALRGG